MNHTMPGIMWALVRQQIQVEAIISALAAQQPSLPEQIMKQLEPYEQVAGSRRSLQRYMNK